MTPRAVIFDLGKVLVDFDYSHAGRRIAARSATPPEQIRQFIDHSPLLAEYETGRVTTQQFFTTIRDATGYAGTAAEFAAAFADIFTAITEMVELHAAIRHTGRPTYILSNTNELAVGHIRSHFPFFSNFDGYVFSHEVGAMKPEAKIYEVVEELSGHRGADLVFIDDRMENIAAATARGWQTVLQETPTKTRAALVKLGVL
ncbi:MAG TPA: HAD family phosphatase [Dongiaceae bacterium]|jgi:HAD superfamily hydrolase (TIGR01509 family)|nr:HAD family phosphatase [Dongiaceae bacterium]